MSSVKFDQQLLENLKREAKKRKREDPSLAHNQWLDALSSHYGFATFNSLKRHVEAIERQAREQEIAAEDQEWTQRFEESLVWGSIAENTRNERRQTLPLPIADDSIPWPNCFCGSSLFTCADGPRRQFDGPVFSMDGPTMYYRGEELRVGDDQTVLMALMCTARDIPCGGLMEFSSDDLDEAIGRPLPHCGIPVQYSQIARTLWRLVNSELKVDSFGFEGPILSYADARQQPGKFAVRFNPDFANFFYPMLRMFNL